MSSIHTMSLEELSEAYLYRVSARCGQRCNPPGDVMECDWPRCNCDPYSSIVIAQLQEQKLESGECEVCSSEATQEQQS